MRWCMKIQWVGILLAGFLAPIAVAENIDPYNNNSQFAWGENIGWVNFEPSLGSGVSAADYRLTGYAWGENIGWINLSCRNADTCGTAEFGVANDGAGNLSGFAWGENVGWINFNPMVPGDETRYGVTIDDNGNFSGWAWGENIGWIRFNSAAPVAFKVQACKVSLDDLTHFAQAWLTLGVGPADMDGSGKTDVADFAIFANYWKRFCPSGWMLKN
jgi:hypothetical protein